MSGCDCGYSPGTCGAGWACRWQYSSTSTQDASQKHDTDTGSGDDDSFDIFDFFDI